MKCQILFSKKNEKNTTNLSSAELAQRVIKVKVFNISGWWMPMPTPMPGEDGGGGCIIGLPVLSYRRA